jgi:hypothetical protein
MIMERRAAIKDIVLFAGSIIILPSCLRDSGRASIALKNIDISLEQEKLLAEIASVIIPRTDIPGAREVGSHLFVLKMLDDCYEKEQQQQFINGLNELENSSRKRFNTSFVNGNNIQKHKLLMQVENKEGFDPDVYTFNSIMKERTIEGFMTSEYVLKNVVKYEMIPSVKYNGYYPVNSLNK